MSGPLTPPETQQPWRAYINTNGAIEEVDFVHNGSPTPTSSPFFKHKISQQRPDLDISQHSMLPLVEEDGDNRRRILLRNDDESRRIRNTQKKGIASIETLESKLDGVVERLGALEVSLSECAVKEDKAMAAKRVVTFYGALKVIARQIDPSLKTKPAKRKSKHPLQHAITQFTKSDNSARYREFCATRPGSTSLFTSPRLDRFVRLVSPVARHQVSQPERDHTQLVSDVIEVLQYRERKGGPDTASRDVLLLLLSSIGPGNAKGHLRKIRENVLGLYEVPTQEILELCAPLLHVPKRT